MPGALESVWHVSNAICKKYPTYDVARSRFLLACTQGIVRTMTAVESGGLALTYDVIVLTDSKSRRAWS